MKLNALFLRTLRLYLAYAVIGMCVATIAAMIRELAEINGNDDRRDDEPSPEPITPPSHTVDLDADETWRNVNNLGVAHVNTTASNGPFRRAKVPPAPVTETRAE